MSVLTSGPPDIENVTEALRTGPYGRCVFDMDNDVMSQQVIQIVLIFLIIMLVVGYVTMSFV